MSMDITTALAFAIPVGLCSLIVMVEELIRIIRYERSRSRNRNQRK